MTSHWSLPAYVKGAWPSQVTPMARPRCIALPARWHGQTCTIFEPCHNHGNREILVNKSNRVSFLIIYIKIILLDIFKCDKTCMWIKLDISTPDICSQHDVDVVVVVKPCHDLLLTVLEFKWIRDGLFLMLQVFQTCRTRGYSRLGKYFSTFLDGFIDIFCVVYCSL